MIAIVDYGVGNLFSLKSSLEYLGVPCVVTGKESALRQADKIILPGVGAFGDAMLRLQATNLVPTLDTLVREGRPLMGICLGMQLLFERGMEYGEWKGLGYLPGVVEPLTPDLPEGFKVPHIGWNALRVQDIDEPLLRYVREGDHVYYVHSFYVKGCGDAAKAFSEYGVWVPGVVRRRNVVGTQFHPEKSGAVGLSMLKAFAEG